VTATVSGLNFNPTHSDLLRLPVTTSHPDQENMANPAFSIIPPLLNSSNPWATTEEDLLALYNCPHTGAVTIRTSLLKGFQQHPSTHQYAFFSSHTGHSTTSIDTTFAEGRGAVRDGETSSLNTLGYSPLTFDQYLEILVRMAQDGLLSKKTASGPKPFIVSVTGSAEEVGKCLEHIRKAMAGPAGKKGLSLMMEINLSCPNIPNKPPPAYDGKALTEYVDAISKVRSAGAGDEVPVGIKTPPYTHHGQFQTLVSALEQSSKSEGGCPITFITATNTLGSCLVLGGDGHPALGSASGTGIGGMAGDALHPLALGNVKTIRTMLDASEHEDVKKIHIVGVGGVSDAAGFRRMRAVGAAAVGVGTALGRDGVGIFEKIGAELN